MYALSAILVGLTSVVALGRYPGALAQHVDAQPHNNLAARALTTLTKTRTVITTKQAKTVTKTSTSTKTYNYYPTSYITSTSYIAKTTDRRPTTTSTLSFVSSLPADKLAARAEKTKTTTVRVTTTVRSTKITGKPKTSTVVITTDYYPHPTVTTVIKATKTITSPSSITTSVIRALREPYVKCGAFSDREFTKYALTQTGAYELRCDHFNEGTGEGVLCVYDTRTGELDVNMSDGACVGPASTREFGEGTGCIDIAACAQVPTTFPGYVFDRANSYKEYIIPNDGDGSRSLFCRYVNPTSSAFKICIYDSETGLGDPFNESDPNDNIFGQGNSSDQGCPAQLGTSPVRSWCIDEGGL